MVYGLLDLGIDCTNQCKICHKRSIESKNLPADVSLISNKDFSKYKEIELLCHSDSTIIKQIKKINPKCKISIKTDGIDIKRVENVNYKIIFNSSDALIHDHMTGTSGSHAKTIKGIKILLEKGAQTEIDLTITKHNYTDLKKTIAFILSEFSGVKKINLKNMIPEKKDQNIIPYREIMPHVIWAIKEHEYNNSECEVLLHDFPLCLFTEKMRDYVSKEKSKHSKTKYSDKCKPCNLRMDCPGVISSYLDQMKDRDIMPVQRHTGILLAK